MKLLKGDLFLPAGKELGVQNVDPSKGFIFVHIPKNAGTSMNEALGIKHGAHYYASEYRKALGWRYNLFFSFCFARNPWSRFLSLYDYARLEESYYHSAIHPEKAKHGKHLDYDILKGASLNTCAHLLLEGKLKHDARWNHWQPQVTWIKGSDGKVIVDYIGRMENIEKDIQHISKKIGMDIQLPKVNVSKAERDYKTAFDPETKEMVAKYYAADIELFGYTF